MKSTTLSLFSVFLLLVLGVQVHAFSSTDKNYSYDENLDSYISSNIEFEEKLYGYDLRFYPDAGNRTEAQANKSSYDDRSNLSLCCSKQPLNINGKNAFEGYFFALVSEFNATKGISNAVPDTVARVIPGNGPFPTLGLPGSNDVFVTAADDIAGLSAKQLSKRLTIDSSDTFTVIKFPTPSSGIASPVNRLDKGFIGGGRTAGGAREFVIPNQRVPSGAITEVVK